MQRKKVKLILLLDKATSMFTINLPGGPAEVLDEATEAAVTGLEAAESV